MEKTEQQLLPAQQRIDQLILADRLEIGLRPGPGFLGIATRIVGRHRLDQHTASAPTGTLAAISLAYGQTHPGWSLFRLGEIALGAERESFSLDRGHALVPLGIRPLVEGHDKDPLTQQGLGTRSCKALADGRDAVGVIATIATQAAVAVVIGHNIGNRPVALGLDDQPPFEFQVGTDQSRQGAGLAQQVSHGFGVVVAGQDLINSRTQSRQTPTHRGPLDREGQDQVIGGGDCVQVRTHSAHMGSNPEIETWGSGVSQWRRSTRPKPTSGHGYGSRPHPRSATAGHR